MFKNHDLLSEDTETSTYVGRGLDSGDASLSYYESTVSYSQESYSCYVQRCCSSSCTEPLFYFINPDYNLPVGIDMGIPKELTFTAASCEVVEGKAPIWSNFSLAGDKVLRCTCPSCGMVNDVALAKDEKSVIAGDYEHDPDRGDLINTPVPINRVYFIQHPMDTWKTVESTT